MGISLNRDMRERRRALKSHIEALYLIKSELIFKNTPLKAIISLLDEKCGGRACDFYRVTYDYAERGLTFSKAAEKNYSMLKKDGLTKEDIEIIRTVCGVLGRYDAAAQVEMINKALERLNEALSALNTELAAKGKLYRAIGATTGIVLALIVI